MTLNLSTLPKVGDQLQFKYKEASFNVMVRDARIRYGNIDVLVEPLNGTGEFWMQIQSAPRKVTTEPTLVNA